MLLARLLASFQSLPALPTMKLGPSGADSRMGAFVYILGPRASLHQTLLCGWVFLPPPQPPQISTARGFQAFFSCAGTLGCRVGLAPPLLLPVYPHTNVGVPATPSLTQSSTHHLAMQPLLPCILAACLHPSNQSR